MPIILNSMGELAQARLDNTTITSIFSPASGKTVQISLVHVSNSTASAATFRLFLDNDGTTYNESTQLAWDVSVPAKQFIDMAFERALYMNNASGNLAFQEGTANALTISVYGSTFTIT